MINEIKEIMTNTKIDELSSDLSEAEIHILYSERLRDCEVKSCVNKQKIVEERE